MDHSQHSMPMPQNHDMHHMNTTVIDHSAHEVMHHHDHAPSSIPMDIHDHSNHDHSNMMQHMMSMAFHGGYNETILFEFWKIDSCWGLVVSMFIIFIMAAIYEGLKYYREHLFWKTYNSLQYRAVTVPEKNIVSEESARVVHMVGEVIHKQPPSMISFMHLYQTILHIIQVTVSFLLMLIFMTYNTWLCIAVVLGAATGYFLFGWKKSVVVDVTEHCH